RIAVISLTMRSITGCGGLAGANTPWKGSGAASFTPLSSKVGTSGSSGQRFIAVTAMARTWPAMICGCSEPRLAVYMSTWPPSAAVSAGPAPVNGMCTILVSVRICSSSPARYGVVPAPGLVQLSLPGLALARAIRSGSDLMSDLAGTVMTFGDAPSTMTGAKSLNGWWVAWGWGSGLTTKALEQPGKV